MSPASDPSSTDRDQLATDFLASLPYPPYPMQEEALLAWFTSPYGVLVTAPTGTGKTLIAEAAVYEALRTNRICYYTTPLIALTEQKFHELQSRAESWGFPPEDIGLVTGHRRINPGAKVLVVVAEILLNRLLNPTAFDFGFVDSVVMDEFHSFNDPERGIVWEMTLGLLPLHVRLLLLSATVGNAYEFSSWLRNARKRDLQLVQSTERRVPLTYHWVPDQFVTEQLEIMVRGDEPNRLTPSLVFCFNREECWNVADQLRGKKLLEAGQQSLLDFELRKYDLSEGAGPKLRQLLLRGVGVHHAGVLPKYRRIVEELFERKLLSVVVCTETLAAGINLPARSVVLPSLVKGAPGRRRLIDASSAHQMFGRAGRPQFDDHGHVVALAHEDDVKIARWKEQYDRIPDNPKDPGLRKAKKAMAKKAPKRRSNETYWSQANFQALLQAVPGKLASRGKIPWRLLGHILELTPDLSILRDVVASRLMTPPELDAGQRQLDQMLLTLWRAGYVRLEPDPPAMLSDLHGLDSSEPIVPEPAPSAMQLFGQPIAPSDSASATKGTRRSDASGAGTADSASRPPAAPRYRAERAYGTELLPRLQRFRSVNPLYGVFLTQQLGIADRAERLQALESVLGFPGSIARYVRVPPLWELPPGALAVGRLDELLLRRGIVSAEQLTGTDPQEDCAPEDRVWPLKFAEKLRLWFAFDYPEVDDIVMEPVWVAGAILEFGGNFNKFVLHRRMQRQEGLVLRHLLRLILLLNEFQALAPPDGEVAEWQADLNDMQGQIVATCQAVDADSTQKTLDDVAASLQDNSL